MKLHPSIQNDQLQDTLGLIDDQADFQYQIINIDFIELSLLLRLNNWLHFFNNNYSNASGIYTNTIFALINATKYNEIFRTQTKHEFDTSLKFYEKIINSVTSIAISNEETAKLLLNISLIYGKYPGMLVRSTMIGINILQNGTSDTQIHKLFEYLFVKYEDPYFLSKNLNNLGLIELEALMMILQGNNIRHYEKLPFYLSRKESFLLINSIPVNLKFEDSILERSIICAKLLLSNTSYPKLLFPFLSFSKVFEFQVAKFHSNIGYWRSVFDLMCQINWRRSTLSLQEYIDYFEYKKYTEDPNYNLNHRTINSISRSIYRWHKFSEYLRNKETLSLRWKGVKEQDLQIKHKKVKYVIKQITTAQNLYKESEEMKHCAFSYVESCVHGRTSIWSIRKVVNSVHQPYLTIEVRKNKIIQIAGKRNRFPNRTDYEVIMLWAHEVGFVVNT